MAYVSKEKKSKIAAELKKVMPKNWKYSLAVKHASTIVLTISAGPEELTIDRYGETKDYRQLNSYYLDREFSTPKLQSTFTKIYNALNCNNHDDSDITTDYFDVGHYINIQIGKWNKPYKVL